MFVFCTLSLTNLRLHFSLTSSICKWRTHWQVVKSIWEIKRLRCKLSGTWFAVFFLSKLSLLFCWHQPFRFRLNVQMRWVENGRATQLPAIICRIQIDWWSNLFTLKTEMNLADVRGEIGEPVMHHDIRMNGFKLHMIQMNVNKMRIEWT